MLFFVLEGIIMKWNKEQLGTYAPNDMEMAWYDFWEKNGYFHQEPDKSKKPFSRKLTRCVNAAA